MAFGSAPCQWGDGDPKGHTLPAGIAAWGWSICERPVVYLKEFSAVNEQPWRRACPQHSRPTGASLLWGEQEETLPKALLDGMGGVGWLLEQVEECAVRWDVPLPRPPELWGGLGE